MVAHLYNQGLQWHHGKQEVIYTIKNVKDAFHVDYQGAVACSTWSAAW
jgi:hypothetical protein